MPSTSAKQARTMAAIAHGWKPSHGDVADIPVSVAKEFNEADHRKHETDKRRNRRLIRTYKPT